MNCRAEQNRTVIRKSETRWLFYSHTWESHQFCSVTKPTLWLGSLRREFEKDRAPGQQCNCCVQPSRSPAGGFRQREPLPKEGG